jgi:hypothetical protein
MIRLNKKLMMFESFAESRPVNTEPAPTPDASQTTTGSTPNDITTDIDGIIASLNDLVGNLEAEELTNESEEYKFLNESDVVDQVLAADLSALPMLALGGGLAAVGGLIVFIKNAMRKKKIKKMYAPVEKMRLIAAKLYVKHSSMAVSDVDPEKRDAYKQKIKAFQDKEKELETKANEVEATIKEAFGEVTVSLLDKTNLLTMMRAETNVKVCEIKLKAQLSETEIEELEQQIERSKGTLERAAENQKKKAAEAEKAANDPTKANEEYEKAKKAIDKQNETLQSQLEAAESEEDKANIQQKIDANNAALAKIKEKRDKIVGKGGGPKGDTTNPTQTASTPTGGSGTGPKGGPTPSQTGGSGTGPKGGPTPSQTGGSGTGPKGGPTPSTDEEEEDSKGAKGTNT